VIYLLLPTGISLDEHSLFAQSLISSKEEGGIFFPMFPRIVSKEIFRMPRPAEEVQMPQDVAGPVPCQAAPGNNALGPQPAAGQAGQMAAAGQAGQLAAAGQAGQAWTIAGGWTSWTIAGGRTSCAING